MLNGSQVLYVRHDYDGDWQFHGASNKSALSSVKIVCLSNMIHRDDSLADLHDLPYGWAAERSDRSAKWERFKNNLFPSYAENGYYLEDAVWLSEYVPDIQPPCAEVRENLAIGSYAKLVFRFAAEDSERADKQCERMWVQVTGFDDDEDCYTGTIANDPHHESAKFDDLIWFHSLHVADISSDE